MYSIDYTHQFKKDLRRCAKRGLDIEAIKTAINILSNTGTLPAQYRPHPLKDDHKGQWECRIQPDWLMTWEQNDNQLTLLFLETGTHVDLFGW
jgi:mRNA interferase YafQ